MDRIKKLTFNSEFNGIRVLGINMLSREPVVAFSPQSKVTALALSSNGITSVWSEGEGLVCISHQTVEVNKEDLIHWKSPGKVKDLIIFNENIFVLDELEGLTCLDFSGKSIWQVEISGGGDHIKRIENRFAIVDSLGRLHFVDLDGNESNLQVPYESIINISVVENNLILAHENGDVQALSGNYTVWKRPARGELGESITSIGSTSRGDLIIGREGYALVPGDEEALELEIWSIKENQMLYRTELNSRLTVSEPSKNGVICGFDDGKVIEIKLEADSKYHDELFPIMDCKHPIKTINVLLGQIICSAWFFISGVTSDGSKWVVEHQGIPDLVKISSDGSVCIFAGEDQNDWTDQEPIGLISLNDELVEIDESELSSWFNNPEIIETLSSEELYGEQQDIEQYLTEEEVKKLKKNQTFDLEESIDALIGALDFETKDFSDEKIKGTLNIDTDELISQLDDAIESLAMLPDNDILDELNSSIDEVLIPIASAGDDQRIISETDGTAIITLDGLSCFDPQNRIITWSWIDESGKEISVDKRFRVKLNIGKHRFDLRICDIDGNWDSDSVSIIIE